MSALAIWHSCRRIPAEKCVRFTCQESGAHSFGRLAAIARAQYRPWREAANPASSQRAHGLAPWQRVCELGVPPSSPTRNVSRKYQRMWRGPSRPTNGSPLLAPTVPAPRQEHQVGRFLSIFEERLARRAYPRTHGQATSKIRDLDRAHGHGKVGRDFSSGDPVVPRPWPPR